MIYVTVGKTLPEWIILSGMLTFSNVTEFALIFLSSSAGEVHFCTLITGRCRLLTAFLLSLWSFAYSRLSAEADASTETFHLTFILLSQATGSI